MARARVSGVPRKVRGQWASRRHASSSRPDVKVRGDRGIIANLYSYDARMRRDMIALNRLWAARTVKIAQEIVPFDTGRMHDSLVAEFSKMGLVFHVKYDKTDFDADGVEYYPPWVEFGTSRMSARPTLGPAYQRASAQYLPALRVALRRLTR